MWRPMEALFAGKLAYLRFEEAVARNCLGYVNSAGSAEWPDSIRGLQPVGWCDVSDMFRLGNEGKQPATAAAS